MLCKIKSEDIEIPQKYEESGSDTYEINIYENEIYSLKNIIDDESGIDCVHFSTEDEAFNYFCKVQDYSGPRLIDPPIIDAYGNKITDWRVIAKECVYAPTSKVHVIKDKNEIPEMKKGDILLFEEDAGYRNDGIKYYDGRSIQDLDDEPDDYGSVPIWIIDENIPLTYFSIPSIHIRNGLTDYYTIGIVDHNYYAPVANKKNSKHWINAMEHMIEKDADYCIIYDKYVVINNRRNRNTYNYRYKFSRDYNTSYLLINNNVYLTQCGMFSNIMREHIPDHAIIHKSKLNISEPDIYLIINKETGIPLNNIYELV